MTSRFFNDRSAVALVQSDVEQNRIEMWTTRRLPFEPEGSLRVAFDDTENVLLYNVGPSAFASATRYGLTFTREFAEPLRAPNEDVKWGHYHVYTLGPSSPPQIDSSTTAKFGFEIPSVSPSLKPHHYWWAAKQGLGRVNSQFAECPGPYEMSINMIGRKLLSNPAALVKPLFDGVISALHFDPSVEPSSPVCRLLAAAIGVSETEIAQALRDQSNALFGCRKVVSPYREFVKWNPADELCLIGRLYPTQCDSAHWLVEVTISAI
jgi:hypothetical protein